MYLRIQKNRKPIFRRVSLKCLLALFLGLVGHALVAQSYPAEKFGAKANTAVNNAKALQKAIDVCHHNGGGTVVLSKGTYLSGTLQLKSNVNIEITPSSKLKGIADSTAYQPIQSSVISRMDVVPWKAFIHADSQKNISIYGGGTIDGSGDAPCFADGIENSPNRPYGIHMINCENIVVRDLHLRSSAFWMQRYFNCRNLKIQNLDVYNHANKNNDGIDIDSSEDVIITGCTIDSSDDALTIKSEGEHPAKNIVVTNCIVASHASAIKLGTGSVGGYENVVISDIVVRRSTSKKMLHPLKVWEGLTGIDLLTSDGGPMRQVSVSNITIEDVENPIHVRLGNRLSGNVARQGYQGNGDELQGVKNKGAGATITNEPVLEDVTLSNIKCYNVGPYPVIIAGYKDHPVTRVTLRDITVVLGKKGNQKDLETPPNWKADGYPGRGMYGTRLPAYGLVTYYTKDLVIENFRAIPKEGEPRPMELHIQRL
ncbi:MAG: glycosyl hydrolase family 28 protein [Bacteroidota bacterium]